MAVLELVGEMLQIGEAEIGARAMALRVLVVFPVGIATVRIGDKRFLGELSAMDLIVAVMIGSIFSRAITGNAPFVPCLLAGIALVLVHRLSAQVAFASDRLGRLLKGRARLLVEDGEIDWDAMRAAAIGEEDLRSALRRKGGFEDLRKVKAAYLERTGDISVVSKG